MILPGKRADVRLSVPADLCFVPDPAQGNAHEVASQGARNGAAKGGLARARRTDEAEDRPLHRGGELAHRNEVEDALFDLLQVVVVFIKDLAGALDVMIVRGGLFPWQVHDPFQVGPQERRLR